MSKRIEDMTISGRIRSLRMALRKAGHPKVDEYDAMYLRYITSTCETIEEAVDALFDLEGVSNEKLESISK